ncbi:DNA processing protein [Oxalobacteraceae bacterium GrIS 2.11]
MSEISDWIRLTATPGIGCDAAKRLLHAFGLPASIFAANYSDLRQVVSERQAKALCLPPNTATQALIERTSLWCAESCNTVLTLADKNYPAQLLEIPDPPTLLYIKGRAELLSKLSVAVVGSRNATAQGLVHAKQFSASLSMAGIVIVSGLALGIDAAAHQGGLEGAGSTIAVVGTGLDVIYPARNQALAHQIARQGCIVSEYPLGTPAIASNFPRRNRLISGLSQGVLVVEAAAQSGSLITARMAAEQGRDVFAIPGSIHTPLAKGCHQLIKQGAKLVENVQDILEELRINVANAQTNSAIGTSKISSCAVDSALLTAMGYEAVHPEDLAQRCKIELGEINAKLVMMELDGQVEMIAGGLYRRISLD